MSSTYFCIRPSADHARSENSQIGTTCQTTEWNGHLKNGTHVLGDEHQTSDYNAQNNYGAFHDIARLFFRRLCVTEIERGDEMERSEGIPQKY